MGHPVLVVLQLSCRSPICLVSKTKQKNPVEAYCRRISIKGFGRAMPYQYMLGVVLLTAP
jgi:hypothetical protein